jgi:uncharacterized protein
MIRLATWQWVILATPIGSVVLFLLIAAGIQIHAWHLSWIWAIFGISFVGWRWLLVKWTKPAIAELDELVAEMAAELPEMTTATGDDRPSVVDHRAGTPAQRAEAALQAILVESREDPPVWADWTTFWQRCLSLISAIAQVYKPEAKQPLLNIYVPQAYVLLRGTIDDMDEWMQRMAPVLNQVTIEQALQAYQIYQKFQPAARRMLQAWGWARWVLNPIAAATNVATKGTRSKATQELLGNFNQLARETVLRNLAQQAILLYSGQIDESIKPTTATPTTTAAQPQLKSAATLKSTTDGGGLVPDASPLTRAIATPPSQSIQSLLQQATPPEVVLQPPVNLLLVGRTGAGKSSLVNSLFTTPVAAVDALPSTDRVQDYHWAATTGETLVLWDTPGYEQVGAAAWRDLVLKQATQADVLLLVTPALDPALQMDQDFLRELRAMVSDRRSVIAPELPTIAVVTQVDRLRPLREWQPPYDWRGGQQPKEVSIREAVAYRSTILAGIDLILPIANGGDQFAAWGLDELATALLQNLDPAKQLRLARFLQSLEARTIAATQLIDRYTRQMTTQQGIAAFLKSPVLQFLTSLTTGSPSLALVLADQIPIEQLPLVIGKAQLAYDLYNLIQPTAAFDLVAIWPLLIDQRDRPDRNARRFGYVLIESWIQHLPPDQLLTNFHQTLTA